MVVLMTNVRRNFLLAVTKLKKYNNFRLIFCMFVLSLPGLWGQTVQQTGNFTGSRGIVQR